MREKIEFKKDFLIFTFIRNWVFYLQIFNYVFTFIDVKKFFDMKLVVVDLGR